MTEHDNNEPEAPTQEANADAKSAESARSARDRWVKLGFLAAIVIAGIAVYLVQTKVTVPPGWGEDLPAALADAKKLDRRVLVFFMGDPPAYDSTKIVKTTMKQDANKYKLREFVKVAIIQGANGDLVKQHKVKTFPTMIILSPDGTELNRREGFIGEVPFRSEFLSCKEIVKP